LAATLNPALNPEQIRKLPGDACRRHAGALPSSVSAQSSGKLIERGGQYRPMMSIGSG